MFVPLIIICTLAGRDCQALAGPTFLTQEQCSVSINVAIQNLNEQIPPELEIYGSTCVEIGPTI